MLGVFIKKPQPLLWRRQRVCSENRRAGKSVAGMVFVGGLPACPMAKGVLVRQMSIGLTCTYPEHTMHQIFGVGRNDGYL